MPTEEIIIEFTADYSSLDGALDVLEKTGAIDAQLANGLKKTTAEFNKQEQSAKKLANTLKGPLTSIDQLDKKSRHFIEQFIKGFEEGVKAELLAAKKEIDAMRAKLEEAGKKGGAATNTLKKELRDLTETIAKAKASGGPVDQSMINKAGELKDAIADANSAISQAGSDTRGLDAVLGSAQAIAGGFALVQGAAALFGDESEELQQTLLKVNAAMSVLQGLQSIQNALTKEGAIVQLGLVIQQKATNAQIAIETGLQSKNIVVKYAAIVAQKALNLVMALTPWGAVIAALAVIIPLMLNWANNTREAAKANAELDSALRRSTDDLAERADFINDQTEKQVIAAQRAGKSEVEILKIRKKGLIELHAERTRQFEENRKALAVAGGDEKKKFELEKQQDAFRKQARKTQLESDKLNLEIQLAEQKELDDAKEKSDAERDKANEKKRQDLADSIADVKRELLTADETAKSYKTLQVALINLTALYDSLGKTVAEVKLIQTQANIDVANVMDATGKAFTATLDKTGTALGDTAGALKGFALETDAVISGTLDSTAETFQQFLDRVIPAIQDGLTVISTLGTGINDVAQEQQNNAEIAIEGQRRQVDELLEAGSITEKEAINRQKRIDQQEKILRRKQAEREKQNALFGAFVNMAQGIVGSFRLLPPFSYINAALVAALGAAQIAAISARPIPNFRTGKKSGWEGFGRYGEAGAELRVNADGRMEYATRPVVDYIGAKDIIYNPAETKQIMDAANARPMRAVAPGSRMAGIDYDKLGAAVGRNIKQTSIAVNVDKHFIRESVAAGLQNKNFYDTRYSFKK